MKINHKTRTAELITICTYTAQRLTSSDKTVSGVTADAVKRVEGDRFPHYLFSIFMITYKMKQII